MDLIGVGGLIVFVCGLGIGYFALPRILKRKP
jgi:hypothetical protein